MMGKSDDGMVALVKKRFKIWRAVLGVGDFVRGAVGVLRSPYIGDMMKAEDFGWELYHAVEGMGLGQVKRAIVLGDGAAWIWNIAEFHFPDTVQIVDWYHATERLWTVTNAGFTEGSDEARDWVTRCENFSWPVVWRPSSPSWSACARLNDHRLKAGGRLAPPHKYQSRSADLSQDFTPTDFCPGSDTGWLR